MWAGSLVETLSGDGRAVTAATLVDRASGNATTAAIASFSTLPAVSARRYGRLVS